MKPIKEQIDTLWHQCTQESMERGEMFTRYAFYERAYAAGRKAGMKEAETLARNMFNRAATGDEIADAIRAAMEADT